MREWIVEHPWWTWIINFCVIASLVSILARLLAGFDHENALVSEVWESYTQIILTIAGIIGALFIFCIQIIRDSISKAPSIPDEFLKILSIQNLLDMCILILVITTSLFIKAILGECPISIHGKILLFLPLTALLGFMFSQIFSVCFGGFLSIKTSVEN